MSTIGDCREAIAEAVTDAGIQCYAYPPDNAAALAPVAFLDVVSSDWMDQTGFFCDPVLSTYTLVALAERNDVASSLRRLEDLIAPIVQALEEIGVRTITVTSGGVETGGVTLPAVSWTLQARTS